MSSVQVRSPALLTAGDESHRRLSFWREERLSHWTGTSRRWTCCSEQVGAESASYGSRVKLVRQCGGGGGVKEGEPCLQSFPRLAMRRTEPRAQATGFGGSACGSTHHPVACTQGSVEPAFPLRHTRIIRDAYNAPSLQSQRTMAQGAVMLGSVVGAARWVSTRGC